MDPGAFLDRNPKDVEALMTLFKSFPSESQIPTSLRPHWELWFIEGESSPFMALIQVSETL